MSHELSETTPEIQHRKGGPKLNSRIDFRPNLCTKVGKNKLNFINYIRNQSVWITVTFTGDKKQFILVFMMKLTRNARWTL